MLKKIAVFALCSLNNIHAQPQKIPCVLQEAPLISYENPLEGIKEFLFIPMSGADGEILIEEAMKALGYPSIVDLPSKQEGEDSYLYYEINNLTSLDGKHMGMQASMYVKTDVEILKTGVFCKPIVWYRSCVLTGHLDKGDRKVIAVSLQYLIDKFLDDYKSINMEEPSIKIVR